MKYESALVVVPQRIGDVLLATPVIASLRNAWPSIAIDVLVFAGTEGVLSGNTDVRKTIVVAQRAGLRERLAGFCRLWRRYDLAISPLCGDRPILYAWAAAKHRFAPILQGSSSQTWKARVLTGHLPFDDRDTHTVRMGLKTVELCGAAPISRIQVCWTNSQAGVAQKILDGPLKNRPFAVLHLTPKYRYKRWQAQAWRELGYWLLSKGLQVVLTGGKEEQERVHADDVFPTLPAGVHDLIGRYSLGEIAALLSHAALFVGPDTATTHLAAGLGIPTVALFGPSNPVKWGPWPKGQDASANPYQLRGTQRVGNVILVQGEGDCVPCFLEGCERHIESDSQCLVSLPVRKVQKAVEALLH